MQFRNTKQKELILNMIAKYGHLTIEQLLELLKNEKISIATIYRNLNILSLEGKIKKVSIDDYVVYETIKQEHFHFSCLNCKKVIDIDPSLVKINISHSKAKITKKELLLYGICEDCQ